MFISSDKKALRSFYVGFTVAQTFSMNGREKTPPFRFCFDENMRCMENSQYVPNTILYYSLIFIVHRTQARLVHI